ncbi:MAG: 3-deoxy-8-phosphooctulonate synthase [Christensenellales bacterium]
MFQLIAGPCVIESEEMILSIAEHMKKTSEALGIPYTFKASFDKANRTSLNGFRGPGLEEGLRILKKVKSTFNLPICTDIHEAWQAAPVAEVADILQIPAFLCRQTDLLVAAAKTGRCVNIKKAQFLAPWDMKNCLDKVLQSGNSNVMLCERGTCFGYNTLVVDMTGLCVMKGFGVPVIFDATHSVQKPGGNGTSTSGNREYVEYLAKAALATGIDGLFMETHPDPNAAKSDGANMVPLDEMETLLKKLMRVYDAVHTEE